ncbi:Deoxyuridine 5'-triphosphate nucleotidohydrolase [Candidatus Entotheonellaceae bacterium PAL068K]
MPDSSFTLNVLIAPLVPETIMPSKAHGSDAGFDLAVPADCLIAPQVHGRIDLGFAVQIPPGWYGQIFGRSSVFQRGLSVHPGVIDADYRGAVQLLVYNMIPTEQRMHRGDRVAQLLILPVPAVSLMLVTPEELTSTTRGTRGMGSTGR